MNENDRFFPPESTIIRSKTNTETSFPFWRLTGSPCGNTISRREPAVSTTIISGCWGSEDAGIEFADIDDFTVSRIPTTSILTEALSNACWHPMPKYQDTGALRRPRGAGGFGWKTVFLLQAGRTGSSPQIDRLYVEHHFPLRKRGPHPEPSRAERKIVEALPEIYFYPGRPFCYYRRVDVSGHRSCSIR